MRIACVHIPQFALQCATRIDPSLRHSSTAVVVVGPAALADARALLHRATAGESGAGGSRERNNTNSGDGGFGGFGGFGGNASRSSNGGRSHTAPIVLACSRAAWSLGARVGMSAAAARSLSPLINVLSADIQIERDTVRALADVLLAFSPVVEVGGRVGPGSAHLALYCEVPAKTRGTTFGDRLLDRLESLGIAGRVGIADDRFTAWVAAWLGVWDAAPAQLPGARSAAQPAAQPNSQPTGVGAAPERRHDETGVVSVPRGGSAAFLAPRPLSLLAISPEVQHMLESLGVRTLGEFAALPAPTVSSRAARFEADYQALARGESGNVLRPYAPDAPIREEAILRPASSAAEPAPGAGLAILRPGSSVAEPAPGAGLALLRPGSSVAAPGAGLAPALGALPAPGDEGLSAAAAVALLAERVALRLAGRARCAARLEITIGGPAGERVVSVVPVRGSGDVLSSAVQLAEAIGSALGDDSSQAWRMRVVVTGEALAGDTSLTDGDALDAALAVPAQRVFAIASTIPATPDHAVAGASAARPPLAADPSLAVAGAPVPHRATSALPFEANPAFSSAASMTGTALVPGGGVAVPASPATRTPATRTAATRTPAARTTATRMPAPRTTATQTAPSSLDRGATAPARRDVRPVFADPDFALSIALSSTGSSVDRGFGLTSPLSSAMATGVQRDSHRRTRRGKQRRRAEVASVVQARLFKI